MIEYEETSLAIDLKYYRMRIYRTTLQGIGKPQYIQFLVNPLKKTMGIRAAENMKMPDQTCRIDWEQLENISYIEIKSKRFLQALCAGIAGMEEGKSYKLSGVIIPDESMVVFSLPGKTPGGEE